MKKKVCKKCKLFVEEETCPTCKGDQFTNSWQGRIYVLDAKNSIVAQKMGIENEGEYAIKTR